MMCYGFGCRFAAQITRKWSEQTTMEKTKLINEVGRWRKTSNAETPLTVAVNPNVPRKNSATPKHSNLTRPTLDNPSFEASIPIYHGEVTLTDLLKKYLRTKDTITWLYSNRTSWRSLVAFVPPNLVRCFANCLPVRNYCPRDPWTSSLNSPSATNILCFLP